jgi:methyl-accepting chemotaxis protein
MAEETKKKKRTQFWVNMRLQYRYVGFIVLALLVISFVMTAFLYYNSLSLVLELKELSMGNEQLEEQLRSLPIFFIVRMLLAMIAVITAVTIIGILEIHKTAGPLFRITRQVRALSEGNYDQRFVLRTRDELKDLASAMNDLQTAIVERETTQALRIDKVTQKVEALYKLIDLGTFEKKVLRENFAELNTLLSEFKKG